jgi:hypothetical protein
MRIAPQTLMHHMHHQCLKYDIESSYINELNIISSELNDA